MKTKLLICIAIVFSLQITLAQVGIGTTDPKASLDITSSNLTNPSNTDGLLIPKIDNFPSTNPGIDQDGMMVYVTGNGTPTKGFYYWDNGTSTWVSVVGIDTKNTLDGAYDEGGAGAGRLITTDNGPVQIDGNGGFRVDSQNNTHMFFINSSQNAIGINTAFPSSMLDIVSTGAGSVTVPVVELTTTNAEDGMHVRLSGSIDATAENLDGVYVSDNSIGNANSTRTKAFSANMNGSSTNTSHDARSFESVITNSSAYIGNTYGFYHLNLSTTNGNQYGSLNAISNLGNGSHYGSYSMLTGSGSGNKYGVFSSISPTAGGTHYGIYSNATSTTGYSGYFIGRTSFGISFTDRYLMPETDGTSGQIITTDGLGQLSFVDSNAVFTNTDNQNLTTATLTGTTLNLGIQNGTGTSVNLASLTDDSDWVTVGANIERQSGNVYIGDTATTNNSLYLSGSIIDWDNAAYNMDLNATSNMARLELDAGAASSPSLSIGDNNTGFYSLSPGSIAHSGNGTLTFNILSDGEITFRGSSPSLYDFSSYNLYENAGVFMGTSNSNSPLLYGFIQNDANDDIAEFGVLSANGNFSHTAVYAHSNLGDNETRLAYNTTGASYALHAVSPSSYAGYFRGTVQLGNSTTNRYNMPPNDGTSGQVMTTDGAGNVTFQDDNSDVDFYEFGTTNVPDDINDDKVTLGTLTIGGNLTPNATLNVLDTDGNNLSGVRSYREFNTTSNTLKRGISSYMGSSSSNSDNLLGFYSQLAGNIDDYSFNYYATNTALTNASTTLYQGDYISTSGNGPLFGSQILYGSGVTNTGDKWGFITNIPSNIPGVHRGVVSDVQKANSFSGVFIGRVSVGNDPSANRYILPTADGTAGQVITTDGSGNLTFQDSMTDTDDQQIDNFSFNTSTNILTLEIEADGQAPQSVDLSSLNPTKSLARITMSSNQAYTGAGWQKINYDTVDFDINSDFNTTTNQFVATTTGYYRVNASWRTNTSSVSTGSYGIGIYVNGILERAKSYNHTGNGQIIRSINKVMALNAGDTVEIYINTSTALTISLLDIATSYEIEQIR